MAKVTALAPAVNVIPVDIITLPYTVMAVFNKEPENPVKSKVFTVPAVIVAAYVPVLKTKFKELASDNEPGVIVVATEPEFEMITLSEPVAVKLVIVPVFHTTPPIVLDIVMFPVPKFIALVVAVVDVNVGQVNV